MSKLAFDRALERRTSHPVAKAGDKGGTPDPS